MDYIVTGGTRFIVARRIPVAESETEIAKTRADAVVWPSSEPEAP